MSPVAERRRDAGFSMVEVVVAIGLLGVLVLATLPGVVGGIRATELARRTTQAKAIVLGETEMLRNLPFFVARNAGPFIDVLDRYYPSLSPAATPSCGTTGALVAPAAGTSGYVADGAARCPWEPDGPMYRRVRVGTAAGGQAGFVVVTNTQFLTDTTPTARVAPPPGWTTQEVGKDQPPARQVGVTVTVFPQRGTVRRPTQSYTQISRQQQAIVRVRAVLDVAALQLGTSVGTPDGPVPLSASAGLVKATGTTSYASSVDAVLSSVAAGLGTGLQGRGATVSRSAPPTATATGADLSDGALDSTDCALVCWGGTRTSALSVSAQHGLPVAGSPGTPLEAALKDPSDGGRALRFGAGSGAAYRPGLLLDASLARMKEQPVPLGTGSECTVGASGTSVRAAGTGWVRTTGSTETPALAVDVCGTARTAPVAVLPTTFASFGVLRVRLARAVARCRVTGGAHTPSVLYDYEALVEVWDGANAYRPLATITRGGAAQLTPQLLADTQLPDGRGPLSRYVQSWSSLTDAGVRTATGAGTASVRIPGVVTILTQPTRESAPGVADPASTMSLNLGAVSCAAEDRR